MTNSKRPCIVWGATGQLKVIYDILLSEETQIIHVFDNNRGVVSPLSNIPVSYGKEGLYSFIDSLSDLELKPDDIDCIAAVGGGNGYARRSITELLKTHGFRPRSLIHRTAIISPLAILGSSLQILAGSIIGPYALIGDYTIVNSGANVDHDCTIGESCHLAPRSTLAGEVLVENNVFVGANATILPRLRICEGAIVGAGSVVTKDVAPDTVVAGNPASLLVR
jgi:sugar O-acyltransferase (sialic acid O-acetyltransferase NeuD family)